MFLLFSLRNIYLICFQSNITKEKSHLLDKNAFSMMKLACPTWMLLQRKKSKTGMSSHPMEENCKLSKTLKADI